MELAEQPIHYHLILFPWSVHASFTNWKSYQISYSSEAFAIFPSGNSELKTPCVWNSKLNYPPPPHSNAFRIPVQETPPPSEFQDPASSMLWIFFWNHPKERSLGLKKTLSSNLLLGQAAPKLCLPWVSHS